MMIGFHGDWVSFGGSALMIDWALRSGIWAFIWSLAPKMAGFGQFGGAIMGLAVIIYFS